MKKHNFFTALILSLCFVLALTGCNPNSDPQTPPQNEVQLKGVKNLSLSGDLITVETEKIINSENIKTDAIDLKINGQNLKVNHAQNRGYDKNIDYPHHELEIFYDYQKFDKINSIYINIPLKDGTSLTADYKFNSDVTLLQEFNFSQITDGHWISTYGLADPNSYDYYLNGTKLNYNQGLLYNGRKYIGQSMPNNIYINENLTFGEYEFYVTKKGNIEPVSNTIHWKVISGIEYNVEIKNNVVTLTFTPNLDPSIHKTSGKVNGTCAIYYKDHKNPVMKDIPITDGKVSVTIPQAIPKFTMDELVYQMSLDLTVGEKKVTDFLYEKIPMFSITKSQNGEKFVYTIKSELSLFDKNNFNFEWSINNEPVSNNNTDSCTTNEAANIKCHIWYKEAKSKNSFAYSSNVYHWKND